VVTRHGKPRVLLSPAFGTEPISPIPLDVSADSSPLPAPPEDRAPRRPG